VVANFATNSNLGSLRLNDDRRKAVLVCPRDPTTDESAKLYYSERPAPRPDEYLVMVHPAYHRGDKAIPVFSSQLQAVRRPGLGNEFELPNLHQSFDAKQAMDRHYRDPMASQDARYQGRWLAGFAPVGNTEFVIIVQQRYDEAITPDYGIWWRGIALTIGTIILAGFAWSAVHRAVQRRSQQSQG
jgi:hypothetical protein